MVYKFFIIISVLFIFSLGTHSFARSNQKPNVLLIVTDDQGSIDVNSFGSKDLTTPNLDKLAKEGIKFTQFYAGSSVCSPSRAGLLTGKTPQASFLPGNATSTNAKGRAGMPETEVTIAELLKDQGYTTAHIGKWHLGYEPKLMPNNQGFDYSFGHMGGCIDNYSHFFYWYGPNRHDLWENGKEIYRDGQYFPDMCVDKASNFIRMNADQPFFMYLAFNTPHYPLQPPVKWREHYKNLEMPRRDYAGFVSATDERIGQVISVLEEENIRDNTIIIFMSDQGHSYEERTFGGGGNAGIYRGGKMSFFDGGIRVPAIISWKGNIEANQSTDILTLSMDLLPTITDWCGVESIPKNVEGTSLNPVIFDRKQVHNNQPLYWQLGKQWAVRKGDWKLLGNPTDPSAPDSINPEKDALFLVNLRDDPSEKINLAKDNPKKVKEMVGLYLEWDYAKKEHVNFE